MTSSSIVLCWQYNAKMKLSEMWENLKDLFGKHLCLKKCTQAFFLRLIYNFLMITNRRKNKQKMRKLHTRETEHAMGKMHEDFCLCMLRGQCMRHTSSGWINWIKSISVKLKLVTPYTKQFQINSELAQMNESSIQTVQYHKYSTLKQRLQPCLWTIIWPNMNWCRYRYVGEF